MEILSKNNIGICFYSKFSSMESIINHNHVPKLARYARLHKIRLIESLLFQLYCGSFFFAMLSLLADVPIY